MIKKYKDTIIVSFIFLIIGILYTWPVIINVNKMIFAQPGDPFGSLYIFYRSISDFKSIFFPSHTIYVCLSTFLSRLFSSEVITFNIFSIFGFLFSALPFYLIVKRITKNSLIGFFAGLTVTISPYRIAQLLQHLTLSNLGFIGFFIYFLILLNEKVNWKNTGLTALFFTLTVLDDYIYGLFAGIILLIFMIIKLIKFVVKKNKPKINHKSIVKIIVPFLLSAVLIGYIVWPFLNDVFNNKNKNNTASEVRNQNELTVYSSYVGYYFLPPENNPILGDIGKDYYQTKIAETGTNTTEQINYLGYTLIILSLFYLIYFIINYRKINPNNRFVSWFIIIIGLSGFYLSFSHPIYLWGIKINPLPDIFFKHVPFFRVYARFAILPLLSLTILSSLGVKIIIDKLKNNKYRYLLIVIILILVMIEFIYLPKNRIQRVDYQSMPEVYKQIPSVNVNTDNSTIIAEYPMITSDNTEGYKYLLWARIHQNRLLNWDINESYLPDDEKKSVYDLNRKETIDLLRKYKVKYIIIHNDKYNKYTEKINPEAYNNGHKFYLDPNKLGLKLLYNKNEQELYEIIY